MREWFAVKRSKTSSYQFYAPDPRNRECIEAIAPENGNFEVITLIEKADFDKIKKALDELHAKYCENYCDPWSDVHVSKCKRITQILKYPE